MDSTINERVKQIADKLCDGNISEMARIIGVRQPSLRDVVTGKLVKPGFDMIRSIIDSSTLNISAEWLVRGEGEMQRHTVTYVHEAPYPDIGSNRIPIYDLSAHANLDTLFMGENTPRVLGEIIIPNAPDCDGTIYVRGDSMDPLVKNGDMISYKQLHVIDSLLSGQMYILDYHLDGNDFLVLKYVKWEEPKTTLRLISYNKFYDDVVIPVSSVRTIALVKLVIKINSMF